MKRRSGFTLVELLVVMAIIAVLASIVVPNVARYLAKSQATKALAEIQSIELALTDMLADANRSRLDQLFDANKLSAVLGGPAFTADEFQAATELYTRALYALMREGRAIISGGSDTTTGSTALNFDYGGVNSIFDTEVVKRLGAGYLDIGTDPWGNLYNIYPGPWPRRAGEIPFRTYRGENSNLPGSNSRGDLVTIFGGELQDENRPDTQLLEDTETELPLEVGFPADRNQVAFLWSSGANLLSSQVLYHPRNPLTGESGYLNLTSEEAYPIIEQGDEYAGGGDDINNWDSNRTWEQFYN